MADKMHTLIIGGEEVQVPAWASEQTMGQVASYMAQQSKTDATFAKVMKKVGGNLGELTSEIQDLVGATSYDIKADNKSDTEQEKFTKKLVKGSNKLNNLMGFFGNHEKPLTAMTDGVSKLAASAKNSEGGFKMFEGMMNSTKGGMNVLGAGMNVAVDAFLAYAGWNAAKLEQFAEVQGKMIDSGILFQGGAAAYDELRKGIQSTGNTYTHLSSTLGTFSDGLLGLGMDVTSGASQFTKFYKQLDTSVDSLGDLGLSSKDMLTAYGEYISYQRRTGKLNKSLNTSAASMNSTFIGMQIEAGGIASLTSLTRQEAMRAQMEAVDDYGNAALRELEARGMPERADMMKNVMESLGIAATKSPEIDMILKAYNLAAYKSVGNPEEFDMSAAVESFAPGMEGQMAAISVNLIEDLERMTKAGIEPAEGMLSYIINEITSADQRKLAAAGTAGNTWATALLAMQASFSAVDRDLGNLADDDALEKAIARQKKDLSEAGKTIHAMNEMGEKFLSVQETLTVDMETTAKLFDALQEGLKGGKSILDKMMTMAGFGGSVDDFGGVGGDLEAIAEAVNGIIPDVAKRESYTTMVDSSESDNEVTVDGDSTTARVLTQMRNNEGEVTAEMLENAGLEFVENIDGVVAYLNSVLPAMAEKTVGTLIEYDSRMKKVVLAGGDAQKITLAGGKTDTGNEASLSDMGAIIQVQLIDKDGKPIMTNEAYNNPDSVLQQSLKKMGLKNSVDGVSGQNVLNKNAGTIIADEANDPLDVNKNVLQKTLGLGTDLSQENIKDSPYNAKINIDGEVPITRKYGGDVSKGQPYIVGDELGMQTAELFVPGESGTIVGNNKFKKSIEDAIKQALGPLTDTAFADTLNNMQSNFANLGESISPSNETIADQLKQFSSAIRNDVQQLIEESVGPAVDTSFSENLKNMQSNLTNMQEPAIMNNSQDLSELIASKKSAIQTVKALQQIVKRYNANEKDKTNTRMLNSR